jgi:hypothetical protein
MRRIAARKLDRKMITLAYLPFSFFFFFLSLLFSSLNCIHFCPFDQDF